MTELAAPVKLAAFGALLAVAFVVALLVGSALPDLRGGEVPTPTTVPLDGNGHQMEGS